MTEETTAVAELPSNSGDCSNVFRLLGAVGTAAHHFDLVLTACRLVDGRDTTKTVAVDMRNCLEFMESKLREIIEETVCPVWGDVTDEVREKCRAAGF